MKFKKLNLIFDGLLINNDVLPHYCTNFLTNAKVQFQVSSSSLPTSGYSQRGLNTVLFAVLTYTKIKVEFSWRLMTKFLLLQGIYDRSRLTYGVRLFMLIVFSAEVSCELS